MLRRGWLILLLCLGLVLPVVASASEVVLEALMGSKAVVSVEGERKMLKPGESFRGVTLVEARPDGATVEVGGQARELDLSRRIMSTFEPAAERKVDIPRNARDQYLTTALINGRSVRVLVDTGANVVALSSKQADSLGLDYASGTPGMVETASGVSPSYSLKLQSVSVGGIQINSVRATVVKGDYPATVLLGMSYLRHVRMQEQNGVLSLSRSE